MPPISFILCGPLYTCSCCSTLLSFCCNPGESATIVQLFHRPQVTSCYRLQGRNTIYATLFFFLRAFTIHTYLERSTETLISSEDAQLTWKQRLLCVSNLFCSWCSCSGFTESHFTDFTGIENTHKCRNWLRKHNVNIEQSIHHNYKIIHNYYSRWY